jgi:hypothetical protein
LLVYIHIILSEFIGVVTYFDTTAI